MTLELLFFGGRTMTQFGDLREFVQYLERCGELKRVQHSVSPHLEMTEVSDRVLRKQGPALLFENPTGFNAPVVTNLFGTGRRIALGLGLKDVSVLRQFG